MEILAKGYLGDRTEVLIRLRGFLFSSVIELLTGDLTASEALWRKVHNGMRGFPQRT